jgi:hypothetical protein
MLTKTKLKYDGRVFNLLTGEYLYYSINLKPQLALVAAYAQSKKDFNTWGYAKYYNEIIETSICYSLGDFSVLKS